MDHIVVLLLKPR